MDRNNYGNERKVLSGEQQQIADEFVAGYNLDYSQISFEGNKNEPIFDYEALNVLRLRLTNITTTDPEIVERNLQLGIVTAKCTAILPDGRSASDLGSAQFPTFDDQTEKQMTLGDLMPDGTRIETMIQAQNLALARALRRAIRAVGINFVKAHQEYISGGVIAKAEIDPEFQSPIGKEIHKLAEEWGHIQGKNKTAYRNFIQSMFGRDKYSSLDLNDIERSQLANMYRNMVASREVALNAQFKQAA